MKNQKKWFLIVYSGVLNHGLGRVSFFFSGAAGECIFWFICFLGVLNHRFHRLTLISRIRLGFFWSGAVGECENWGH